MAPRIALIDAANILHRAYFAAKVFNPSLTADDAIKMAISIVLKNLRELGTDPRHALMAGEGGATWRKEIFPDYKKGRKERDEVLAEVLRRGYTELSEGSGVKLIEVAGFEADDVLATYADLLDNQYYETYIVTGDKDLLQCLSGTTSVLLLKQGGKGLLYRMGDFRTEYGFTSGLFADYKSLLGDDSDAIPGVLKIGEKRGRNLVAAYGNLDRIYRRVEELDPETEQHSPFVIGEPMTPLVRRYLIDGKEIAFRNIELMRVRRDVPGVALKG